MHAINSLTPSDLSHDRVRKAVINYIVDQQLSPGDKLPSQSELVKVLNCSESTIQKAMKEIVDDGLVKREVGRGTFLAKKPELDSDINLEPVTKMDFKGGTIAICSLDQQEKRPFFSPSLEILHSAENALINIADNCQAKLSICRNLDELKAFIEESQPEGLLMDWRSTPLCDESWKVQQYTNDLPFPTVHCMHTFFPEVHVNNQICLDDHGISYLALEHLLKKQHNNVLIAGNSGTYEFQNSRLIGAQHFAQSNKIKITEFIAKERDCGDSWEDAGEQAFEFWQQLPKSKRPGAVYAINDKLGFSFIASAKKAGLKIPEDLSVIGVDNDMFFRLKYKIELTTVDPRRSEIGIQAVKILVSCLRGANHSGTQLLKIRPKLLERGSVKTKASN